MSSNLYAKKHSLKRHYYCCPVGTDGSHHPGTQNHRRLVLTFHLEHQQPMLVGELQLTSKSRSDCRLLLVLGLIAHPFFTAFARKLHSSGVRAVRARQADTHGAERHAAHCAVKASALVLAAALEGLPTPVHHASKHTRGTIPCCKGEKSIHENSAGGKSTPALKKEHS